MQKKIHNLIEEHPDETTDTWSIHEAFDDSSSKVSVPVVFAKDRNPDGIRNLVDQFQGEVAG